MIFASPQIRDAYYKLSTAFQVAVAAFWYDIAKRGYHIYVEQADSAEIIIRISEKPKALPDSGSLEDDHT